MLTMVTLVVIINLFLALNCFHIAWKVWQFRRAIATAADALLIAEQNAHAVLHGAPDAILKGQIGTHQLRQSYRQLEPQYQKARRALALLSLGQTVWRRRARFLPLPSLSQQTPRMLQNKSRK